MRVLWIQFHTFFLLWVLFYVYSFSNFLFGLFLLVLFSLSLFPHKSKHWKRLLYLEHVSNLENDYLLKFINKTRNRVTWFCTSYNQFTILIIFCLFVFSCQILKQPMLVYFHVNWFSYQIFFSFSLWRFPLFYLFSNKLIFLVEVKIKK